MAETCRELAATAHCAWCDRPTKLERLVEHARTARIKGKLAIITPDRYAPCCIKCNEHLPPPVDPVTRRASVAGRAGAWKKRWERLL